VVAIGIPVCASIVSVSRKLLDVAGRHVAAPPPVPVGLVDQDAPDVGVRVVGPLHLSPVPEGLGQGLLDQVLGQVPVAAE
jgi:hypothetical protein